MGDERAETYLRLRAEAELRRATGPADGLDPAGPADGVAAAWEIAPRAISRAGRILAGAGALDEQFADRVGAELSAALIVRSRTLLSRLLGRGLPRFMFGPPGGPAGHGRAGPARPMRVTPVGQALRVADERAPSTLHLMSLVRAGTEAVITVAMQMHWPEDGSSADLEITGAGPHHLPYERLRAVDDRGTRYLVQAEGDGGTAVWRGVARVARLGLAPPRSVRWLDLVGDGARLVRLDLRPPAGRGVRRARSVSEPAAPAERLLIQEAERILAASGDVRAPAAEPDLGEMVTVLTEAGALPADSPVPGQLAALCERLGTGWRGGITVVPAARIPAPWASVLARRDAAAEGCPEVFAPLAAVLPEVDGTRFALAGLSSAAGESHLHVVATGMPPPADPLAHGWRPGYSWWLGHGAGNWHLGTPSQPGRGAGDLLPFLVRLTPPLAAVPEVAEVVVTGTAARVRAAVRVRGGPGPLRPAAARRYDDDEADDET